MSFLEDVTLSNESPTLMKSKSSFLSSVVLTEPSKKLTLLRQQEAVAKQKATEANSLSGILKGTASDLGSRIAQTGKDIYGALTTPPAEKSLDMQKSLEAGWDTIATTVQDTAKRFENVAKTYSQPSSLVEKGAATGEAAMGVLNNLFLGITAPLKAVQGIPVVGYLADGVNNIFSALGAGGASVASDTVDGLPVSQKTKDTIRPLIQEVGALTAQIVAGKVGGDVVARAATKSKAILDTLDSEIQVARTAVEKGIPKKVPVSGETITTEVSFANKYEQPTTIPFGTKGKETLPSIQIGTQLIKSPYIYEPVKGGFLDTVVKPEAPVAPELPRTAPITSTRRAGALPEIKGTGEIKARGLSQGIEAKAIENELSKGFGDLPEYRQVSMAEQAQKAYDFLTKNPEEARAVALGQKAPPRGMLPESVLIAVERRAIAEGDVATMRELAVNSRLSLEATTMGQRIRTLAERDPTSPVGAIKTVQDARTASYEKRTGTKVIEAKQKVVESIKGEMKKAISKRPTWEQFIKDITCGY